MAEELNELLDLLGTLPRLFETWSAEKSSSDEAVIERHFNEIDDCLGSVSLGQIFLDKQKH